MAGSIGNFFITFMMLMNHGISQGLIIQQGAYLISKNSCIVVKKNWINNGTFLHNYQGSVVFAGNGNQYLGGSTPTLFFQLFIENGSSTHLASTGHSIFYRIRSNGTFYANKGITLLSDIHQTALVDGNGTGEIRDSLLVQATIARAFGYKYLGTPFRNSTVQGWAHFIQLAAPFPSIYSFEEDQLTNGWNAYANQSNSIDPMRGYAIQFDSSGITKTITTHGVVNNGELSLTLYNHNKIYTRGFQLVSNPYPSPINWDAASGWTKTNIDNAIYFFDSDSVDVYGGKYNSYINGISSDGISNNIIQAMQAFFVHVSDGAYPVQGLLGINNQVRLNQITKPYRDLGTGDNKILLSIESISKKSGMSDRAIIYFDVNASHDFNPSLDALKIMNTSNRIPSLYSIGNDERKLSINAIPFMVEQTKIPLGLTTKEDGIIILRVANMRNFPASLNAYLYDRIQDHYYPLTSDANIEMELSNGTYEKRFYLVFSKSPIQNFSGSSNSDFSFSAFAWNKKLLLKIRLPDGEKSIISILNIYGQPLYRKTYDGSVDDQLDTHWPTGIYLVSWIRTGGTISKTIFIGE